MNNNIPSVKDFFEDFMTKIQEHFLKNDYKNAISKAILLKYLIDESHPNYFDKNHNSSWYINIDTKEWWTAHYKNNKNLIISHLTNYYDSSFFSDRKKEFLSLIKIIEQCENIQKLENNISCLRNCICYNYSLNVLLNSKNIDFDDLKKKIKIVINNNNNSRRKKLTYHDNSINNVIDYNEYLTLWEIIVSYQNSKNINDNLINSNNDVININNDNDVININNDAINIDDEISNNTVNMDFINAKKKLSKPLENIRTLSKQIATLIPELKDGIIMSTTANEYMKKKGNLELAISDILNDKEEIKLMFEQIKNTQNEKRKNTIANRVKTVKQKIPTALRAQVWDHWIGTKLGQTKCLCCNVHDITQLNFVCGHIVSEHNGGKLTIKNLKPVCMSCNSSMQTQNMDEFIKKYELEMHKNITCVK